MAEDTIKLDTFTPRWYQQPIFDAIENKGYKRVLAILPRRCLSGSSHITMADGSFKLLQDIQPGDKVLSWNGEQFVADTVKHAWQTDVKTTKRVQCESCPPLITSSDHVFAHSSQDAPYDIHWSRLKDIQSDGNLIRIGDSCCHIKPFRFNVHDEGEEKLYDIETKQHHNFVANGYLVHNSGKDLAAFNLCVRQCLRKRCVVYYILPTYAQAKKTIWDSITNEGIRFLDYIPDEVISSKNSQEMKIWFVNGSLLQLVGSLDYNKLMGTNPQACVFSEYALQDPKAFDYIRPILNANKGWAVFLSCVAPDTIVFTDKGMERIKDVSGSRKTYSELNRPVYGKGGFHNAEQFYYGGWQPTLKITLRGGFQLECTPIHPIWDGTQWIQAQHLKVGDRLPIQYGQEAWGPGLDLSDWELQVQKSKKHEPQKQRKPVPFNLSFPSRDFCYLLGLIVISGTRSAYETHITARHRTEIENFLYSYGFKLPQHEKYYRYGSRALSELLTCLGVSRLRSQRKIPERMFQANREQMKAFIQGIFDAEAYIKTVNQTVIIQISSTSKMLVQELQTILLNFGIISSFYSCYGLEGHFAQDFICYELRVVGYFAHVFFECIGFNILEKQQKHCKIPDHIREGSRNSYPIDLTRLVNHRPMDSNFKGRHRASRIRLERIQRKKYDPYIEELLQEKLYFSDIVSIEHSENYVYDFVIPETHSFTSNGYLSHNTPRGRNHLWNLYQVAKDRSSEWFCYHLTVDDTQHISKESIERERQEGLISEDLIQQEYFTSFQMGIEGAYYAKYLDDMRLRSQIGHVPYDPGHLVHTAWDLGVRDSTAIIFFQVINRAFHIIDCYSNTNIGLEDYIHAINQRSYVYGKHIAPHDIKVREFSSGISRWEKAKNLGVTFTIAPNMHINDGIEAVRSILPLTYIDTTYAQPVVDALENYRKEFDEEKQVYKPYPRHDRYSHMADAIRMMAVARSYVSTGMSREELREHYYGANQKKLPQFFQTNT